VKAVRAVLEIGELKKKNLKKKKKIKKKIKKKGKGNMKLKKQISGMIYILISKLASQFEFLS
jgi:hypothetical protein